MAHLNFFGIDNFRAFKDLNRFEFRPITVLVGTNSSGKSSLSKGILCLKSAFEEIKFRPSSRNAPVSQVGMESADKIHFKTHLNLGNFENCINRDSGEKEISFELPIKFSILDDMFTIRFTYEQEENALKNGIQKRVKIFHLDSESLILDHNNEDGILKINFSFLKSKLDEAINKTEIIDNIEDTTNINGFDTIDLNSFSSDYIYGSSIYEFIKKYNYKLPLLTYSFIFNDDFLKKYEDILDVLEVDFKDTISIEKLELFRDPEKKHSHKSHDFINKNTSIRKSFLDKIKDRNLSITELLKNIELDALSNIYFQNKYIDKRDPSMEFHLFFRHTIGMITDLLSHSDFYENMLEKESLYEIIVKENLFLKPIEGLVPDNLAFFTKEFIHDGIGRGLNNIGDIYRSMHYIPSVRTKVDRIFRIGNNDSYLQEVLFQFHQTKLSNEAKTFINDYLKEFEIADSIDLVLSSDSDNTKIFLEKNGSRSELADLGYGISQVLPIILKLGILISESAPNNIWQYYYSSSSVIIEEPETNLHPALQSKLADMFVECYQKYNIQFIIETHSEYLIRKLQYLTAKKTIKTSDSVIYYFHHPDNVPVGEKQVKKIEILEDGSLTDEFGAGFYDEATNWKFELLRLKNIQNN